MVRVDGNGHTFVVVIEHLVHAIQSMALCFIVNVGVDLLCDGDSAMAEDHHLGGMFNVRSRSPAGRR